MDLFFLFKRVYLDYNATTPLDTQVAQAISKSLIENWHNPSSQYKNGIDAKRAINLARDSIAKMLNSYAANIIFVSGGTEANNIVFNSCLQEYKNLKKLAHKNNDLPIVQDKPHIIISNIEDDSVKLIAEHYEKEGLAGIFLINF